MLVIVLDDVGFAQLVDLREAAVDLGEPSPEELDQLFVLRGGHGPVSGPPLEDPVSARKRVVAIFVDRSSQQWVVRDPDGEFWILPSVDDPWHHRLPFQPTEETDLEPIPGHYRYVLGLPF